MSVIRQGNFCWREPPFENGDVIEGCNCSQLTPNTEICKGVLNLTINGGNFVNCKPQPSWVVNGGNWAQKSMCSHEHPEWLRWGLPACKEDCQHRQGSAKQWVEIEEGEFKELTDAALEPATPKLQVRETADSYGIKTQKFEKEVFVYEDKYVGCNRPHAAKASK